MLSILTTMVLLPEAVGKDASELEDASETFLTPAIMVVSGRCNSASVSPLPNPITF